MRGEVRCSDLGTIVVWAQWLIVNVEDIVLSMMYDSKKPSKSACYDISQNIARVLAARPYNSLSRIIQHQPSGSCNRLSDSLAAEAFGLEIDELR